MKDLDKEAILDKMENEGFDYYMMNYGGGDLEDTSLEPLYDAFIAARNALMNGLWKAGIEYED